MKEPLAFLRVLEWVSRRAGVGERGPAERGEGGLVSGRSLGGGQQRKCPELAAGGAGCWCPLQLPGGNDGKQAPFDLSALG